MTSNALMASASSRAMFHAPAGSNMMIRGPMVAYAPDDGAMSVDQAAAALREPPPAAEPEAVEDAPEGEPEAEPEAEEAPEQSEAEPTAEEDLDPEAVIEETTDEEPESDPDTPAIAAPQSWDAEGRALWPTLPPAAQEIILKRDAETNRAVSKAQQEAGTVRKQAEADLVALSQIKTTFDEIATKANKVFADKWANVDWLGWAAQDPAAYTLGKAQYDAEMGELRAVQQATIDAEKVKQQADDVQFQNYVREEADKLVALVPELADPKLGQARRTAVAQFLLDDGFEPENIRRASAAELRIAWESKQYRALKATGKLATAARPATPATRPTPAPARAAAPSAAPQVRSPRIRNVETAMADLTKSGSVDAGIAALQAMRGR
jgi:hypothetical protein